MSDAPSGLEVLQTRVQRRSRSVPPPRRPPDEGQPSTESRPGGKDSAGERPAAGESEPRTAGESERPAAGESEPRTAGESKRPSVTAIPGAPARTATASTGRRSSATRASTERSERPTTSADEPVTNLAVRVRRSLDDRLSDILYALRKDGVRSSKVELIEMLLWELPPDASDSLRGRLAEFRAAAPRQDALSPASKEERR